jgi:hypothetical protein
VWSSYPTEAALRRLFKSAVLDPGDTPLDWAIRAGIESFERACDRHFLAGVDIENNVLGTAGVETRFFDPPTVRSGRLWLGPFGDLATSPTVVYQPGGSLPLTWAENTDYWVQPRNALARGRPITHLVIRHWPWSGWLAPLSAFAYNSVQVSAKWGYNATHIPDDAVQAMLAAGALQAIGNIEFLKFGATQSWRAADGTSVTRGPKPFAMLTDEWQARVAKAVGRYKRWEC